MKLPRGMLDGLRRWLAGKYREIPLEIAAVRARIGGSQNESLGVKPENIVWIFGTGRSGSTWLRNMMGDLGRHRVWEEPLVGRLFGEFYDRAQKSNLRRPDFVLADATRRGWIQSIRTFVLDGARYARPGLGPGDYLVVKEPNGSAGAPLLIEALPESRMVLLVRDPRDVVASTLEGAREGNWLHEWKNDGGPKRSASPNAPRGVSPDEDPDAFVRLRSRAYLLHAGKAKEAYDAHDGPKTFVRYEDLRADTLGTMTRLYRELGIAVEAGELARAVEKHAWENIPEEEKGEGKFYRRARPEGWREDLTPEQAGVVEGITAPLLEEFYPGRNL